MNYYNFHIGDFNNATQKVCELPSVYIVATHDLKFIKVGMTVNIKQRLSNIQSGCPFPLFLWLSIKTPTPKKLEAAIHRLLRDFRSHGEWFCPDDQMLDFISLYASETNKHVKQLMSKKNSCLVGGA